MFEKNLTKISAADAEGPKVGLLTTQIVYNKIIDNKYKLWFISNEMGSDLHYTTLPNGLNGTVAHTDFNMILLYVNRENVKKVLMRRFGQILVIPKISPFSLTKLLNPLNIIHLGNVFVNPTHDFFVPIALMAFRDVDIEKFLGDDFIIDGTGDEGEFVVVKYNRETKKYETQDSNAFIELIS